MKRVVAALGLACAAAAQAQAQGSAAPSRGELLYATHCNACHTTQMHWRERRAAKDWTALKTQVRRWQNELKLNWSEADITEVARHLNQRFYHHPERDGRAAAPAVRVAAAR
ncbi:MAG: cytochrome C [Piscinibacter sp.]|nr:cytochrome C [Piscinibacter sp.]